MWKKVQNCSEAQRLFRGNVLTKQTIKQKINSFAVLLLKEKGGRGKSGKENTICMVSLKSIHCKDRPYGEDIRLRVLSGWHSVHDTALR